MDGNGWIPREIILGPEARSRVPKEFQTQYSLYANPPSFSIHLRKLLDMRISKSDLLKDEVDRKGNGTAAMLDGYLKEMYPKYLKHYYWLRSTQRGDSTSGIPEFSVFRWRGRKGIHILTSGTSTLC
jgi:mannosyl-oligosaccharide glucosidase